MKTAQQEHRHAELRAEHVVVPLDGVAAEGHARLSFDNGAERLAVSGHAPPGSLVDAQFADPLPAVWWADRGVHVEYPLGARLLRRIRASRIRLSTDVPWSLDVHGGAAHVELDLRELATRAVSLHSGAAHVKLRLGHPDGQCAIRLASVSSMRIERPRAVPVRLELSSGVANLRVDERRIGSVGHHLVEQTPGWDDAVDRLLIVASAGVNDLTVDHRTDAIPFERSRRNHPSRRR